MAGAYREALIDFEFLRGRQNETVFNELGVASVTASETFRFKSPYKMAVHGSSENGINWADGRIEYREFYIVLNDAVSFLLTSTPTASKVTYLSGLTGRPIRNLEDLICPPPDAFNHRRWCTLPCYKFLKFACATKTTHSLYDWLMHHLQTKDYVQCVPVMTRHTADFVQPYKLAVHTCRPRH